MELDHKLLRLTDMASSKSMMTAWGEQEALHDTVTPSPKVCNGWRNPDMHAISRLACARKSLVRGRPLHKPLPRRRSAEDQTTHDLAMRKRGTSLWVHVCGSVCGV
jgi:hypothetical protein